MNNICTIPHFDPNAQRVGGSESKAASLQVFFILFAMHFKLSISAGDESTCSLQCFLSAYFPHDAELSLRLPSNFAWVPLTHDVT